MTSQFDALMLPLEIPSGRVFHVCMAVTEIEPMMGLLSMALRLHWTAVRDLNIALDFGEGETITPIRAVYSREGPPYIELISGPAESFFAAGSDGGGRLHHAGIFIEGDIREEAKRLEGLGMTVAAVATGDSTRIAFVLDPATGLHLELMSPMVRNTLDAWFQM